MCAKEKLIDQCQEHGALKENGTRPFSLNLSSNINLLFHIDNVVRILQWEWELGREPIKRILEERRKDVGKLPLSKSAELQVEVGDHGFQLSHAKGHHLHLYGRNYWLHSSYVVFKVHVKPCAKKKSATAAGSVIINVHKHILLPKKTVQKLLQSMIVCP